jgi:hypothetical protein
MQRDKHLKRQYYSSATLWGTKYFPFVYGKTRIELTSEKIYLSTEIQCDVSGIQLSPAVFRVGL